MKLALMLGGMAAGRSAGGPGQLLAKGGKLIGQSDELTKLADEVRGRLLDAGKSAAVAVAARQVESLTERVGRRVEDLAQPTRRSSSGPAKGRDARDEPMDGEDDEPDGAEPEQATTHTQQTRPRRAARRPAAHGVADDGGAGRAKAGTSSRARAGGSTSGSARRGGNAAGSVTRARRRSDDG